MCASQPDCAHLQPRCPVPTSDVVSVMREFPFLVFPCLVFPFALPCLALSAPSVPPAREDGERISRSTVCGVWSWLHGIMPARERRSRGATGGFPAPSNHKVECLVETSGKRRGGFALWRSEMGSCMGRKSGDERVGWRRAGRERPLFLRHCGFACPLCFGVRGSPRNHAAAERCTMVLLMPSSLGARNTIWDVPCPACFIVDDHGAWKCARWHKHRLEASGANM